MLSSAKEGASLAGMAETACRVCGSDGPRGVSDTLIRVSKGGREFAYVKCRSCGSLNLLNPPSDFREFYRGESYYSHAPISLLDAVDQLIRSSSSYWGRGIVFRLLNTFSLEDPGLVAIGRLSPERNSPILDVGCGSGRLLQRLHFLGFSDLHGVDPFCSPRASNGLEILRAGISDVRHDRQYSLIMFHHSLEHTLNPEADLLTARRLLDPSGFLIVRIPVASLAFHLYGPRWNGLADAPRHTFVPTLLGLVRLLNRCGFRPRDSYFDSNEWEILCSGERAEVVRQRTSSKLGTVVMRMLSSDSKTARREVSVRNRLGLADSVVVYARVAESQTQEDAEINRSGKKFR